MVWNGSTLYVGYSINPSNLKSLDLQSWDILLNYFSDEFLPSIFSVLSFRNFYCLDVVSPRPLSLSLLLRAFLKFTCGFLLHFLSTIVFLFSKNYCLFLNFGHIFLYFHWCKIFSYYFKNWYINIMLVFFCLHRLWFLQGTFFSFVFTFVFLFKEYLQLSDDSWLSKK